MSDATERLAPVSYLPWATPDDGGRAADAADVAVDEEQPDAIEEPAQHARVSGATRWGTSERSRRGGADRGSGRSRTRGLAAVGSESDRDERAAERSETGPERDDRIDRLVVSRLRRSALSIAEVRAVLVEHGLDEVEVEEWIERYERLGYLDDARLAEQLVHVNGSRRGRGSGAILQELSRRGVDTEAARAAVSHLDPEIERANAFTVAERRARQLAGLDRQTAERRLSAFLQRRGYPGEVVREAVTAALSADGS